MKMLIHMSLLCIVSCTIVAPVISDSSLPSRRETLALFRGFLCYLKGESLKECRADEDVDNVMASLTAELISDDDSSRPAVPSTKKSSGIRPQFPLPPQGARKRDAFYSDWKRK